MAKKPTHADAQLILQLYDLRREAEMRKARVWWVTFDPRSADDFLKVAWAVGTQENSWLRRTETFRLRSMTKLTTTSRRISSRQLSQEEKVNWL